MKKENTKVCAFSLTPRDKKFIDQEAAKLGLSSSAWLRLIVRAFALGQSKRTPPTVEDFVNLYYSTPHASQN